MEREAIKITETVVEEKSLLDLMAENYVPEIVRKQRVSEAIIEDAMLEDEEKVSFKSMAEIMSALENDEDLQDQPEPGPGRDICGICWHKWCTCDEMRVPLDD